MSDKVNGKEITWYVIGGLFILAAAILITFGLIGYYIGGVNSIIQAEQDLMTTLNIPLDFRMWGVVFLFIGSFIIIVTLAVNAKKTDRVVEKTIRRQQRMSASKIQDVVEADVVSEK